MRHSLTHMTQRAHSSSKYLSAQNLEKAQNQFSRKHLLFWVFNFANDKRFQPFPLTEKHFKLDL